jgi:hypothetical protein
MAGTAILIAMAAYLMGAYALRAITTFDAAWDNVAYHFPYAARLSGICDTDCLQFVPHLELFYTGFPVAIELIQGWIWRLTGVPELTNLVALASFVLLIGYLQLHWNVPWYWSVLAFSAIPFVQIFATSSYLDLTVNVFATIALVTVAELLFRAERVGTRIRVVFWGCLVLLGNSKTQMMPIALALGLAFVALDWWTHGRPALQLQRWLSVLLTVFLLALVSATMLRNVIAFGNPVFPVEVVVGGSTLLHGVVPPLAGNSAPLYLTDAPQAWRWLLSVLEYSALDLRWTPYTLGQGEVPQTAPSFRMGGYFTAYVLFTCALLVVALTRQGARGWLLIAYLAALTAATAILPASHELRYYMFWILTPVVFCLILFASSGSVGLSRLPDLGLAWKCAALSCLLAVTLVTGLKYVPTSAGVGAREFVTSNGFQAAVDNQIADGDIVCVAEARFAILYSAAYNPGRTYKVIQGDDPSCTKRF